MTCWQCQVGYIDVCVWCNVHCTTVPSILEPLVRGPPQEAAKLNTFMREPLFSLRLNIRCDDYFFNSVSNDAVITNHITCMFCFLHAGGSHLVLITNVHCVCYISWVPGWIPSLWLITNYNVGVAKYAPSSIIVMAISIAGKHGLKYTIQENTIYWKYVQCPSMDQLVKISNVIHWLGDHCEM